MTATASTPFRLPVSVYWEDTDAGGVVYYANYLKYFERARTDWLRALGVSQQTMKEQHGAMFVVAAAQLRYLQPARLDDRLEVTAALAEPGGGASLRFQQQVWRGATLLVEGQVRAGCVDAASFRPRRIPESVLQALARPR